MHVRFTWLELDLPPRGVTEIERLGEVENLTEGIEEQEVYGRLRLTRVGEIGRLKKEDEEEAKDEEEDEE